MDKRRGKRKHMAVFFEGLSARAFFIRDVLHYVGIHGGSGW